MLSERVVVHEGAYIGAVTAGSLGLFEDTYLATPVEGDPKLFDTYVLATGWLIQCWARTPIVREAQPVSSQPSEG